MSTTFRFVEDSGRTARPEWLEVTTPYKLKRVLTKHSGEDMQTAVRLFERLELRNNRYVLAGNQAFTTATSVRDALNSAVDEHEARGSWGHVPLDDLLKAGKLLNAHSNAQFSSNTVDLVVLRKVKRLLKGLDAGSVQMVAVDAVQDFARAEAYALFVAQSNNNGSIREGYLGHGGATLVPLQRARMFDSEIAVEKFLRGHYFLNFFGKIQMVKLNVSMTQLCRTFDGKNGGDRLADSRIQHAAAFVQKENIESALNEASRERLQQRLDEMDTPIVAVTKRKM